MKILFLCGSLEPGYDGVGDYTRRLAAALITGENSTCIISLNDRFVSQAISLAQLCNSVEIPVYRIPASLPEKRRVELAAERFLAFKPEWISLQFVPYSFNKRGLPFTLASRLGIFGKTARWHVMFHELWIGMEHNSSTRQFLTGYLQQYIINSLIETLKPFIIHTHTSIYQQQLSAMRYNSKILPLFSNISSKHKICRTANEGGSVRLVVFGSIHPYSQVADFTMELAAYARENLIEINLTVVGNSGSERDKWLRFWSNAGIQVNIHADRSDESISEILRKAHIGISTYPLVLAEKSSSIAAMQEHGLPVICIGKIWKPRIGFSSFALNGLVQFEKGNIRHCFSQNSAGKIHSVSETATLFVESLANFNT